MQVGIRDGAKYCILTFWGKYYGFTFSCGLAFSSVKRGNVVCLNTQPALVVCEYLQGNWMGGAE